MAPHDLHPAEKPGLDSESLIRLLTGPDGLAVRTQAARLQRHRNCFTGSALTDFLVSRLNLGRVDAVHVGTRLLAQDHIRHVTSEADFVDGPLLYQFTASLQTQHRERANMAQTTLAELTQAMRGENGVRIGNHRHRLVSYPNCFTGRDATTWLVRETGATRAQAAQIGESMLQSNHIRHVFDEWGFEDGNLFYRFL